MEQLKPCPFCGRQPRMNKEVRDVLRGQSLKGELEIYWWLKCDCGMAATPRIISYYKVNDEGVMELNDKTDWGDGREKVIKRWNERVQVEE